MPRRAWRERVEDILAAIERIGQYTENLDYEAFSADQKTIDACVRNLEIIGEAANHIPDEIKSRDPALPWVEMRGMRNLISHAYFTVDTAVVWKTCHEDLPRVRAALRHILDEIA